MTGGVESVGCICGRFGRVKEWTVKTERDGSEAREKSVDRVATKNDSPPN